MANVRVVGTQISNNRVPSVGIDRVVLGEAGRTATFNVLVNDHDADGNALAASLISQPGQGTVELNGDGSATYTTTVGAAVRDWFQYEVSDGNGGTGRGYVAIIFDGDGFSVVEPQTVAESEESGDEQLSLGLPQSSTAQADTSPAAIGQASIQEPASVAPSGSVFIGIVLLALSGLFLVAFGLWRRKRWASA